MESPNDGLWLRFLDGEAVDPDEVASLMDRAGTDEPLRAQLLNDTRIDGWMRGLLRDKRDGGVWTKTMVARLAAEQTRDEFVARVTTGIESRLDRRVAAWFRRGRVWIVAAGAVCAAMAGLWLARLPQHGSVNDRPGALTSHVSRPNAPIPGPQVLPSIPAAADPRVLTGPRETIRAFDFEDGVQSLGWHFAPTRQCPPRPSSRFCLMARKDPDDSQYPDIVGVRIENRNDGIFVHEPGTVIAFDYWLGQSTVRSGPRIDVWLSDDSAHSDYHLAVGDAQTGRWVHVELSVDDFRPHKPNGSSPMKPGNRVGFMLIQTSWTFEDVLFVDNVRFERPSRTASPRP